LVVRVKVRVNLKVRVIGTRKSLDIVVLANGGAESPKPCIVVNREIAESLSLWPPPRAEIYVVEEASVVSEVYLIPNSVVLELLDEKGNTLSSFEADLAIQEGLKEPLITDITIDELGIQVISFSKGLWRHRNDPPDMVRSSAK